MKYFGLISCLAATALIASPVLGVPQKKSAKSAQSHTQRMAPRTTQMAGAYRRGNSSSYMGTRQYTGTQRYAATRQYSGTRYSGYNGFASNSYYNGSRYYYGGPGYYYGAGLSYPYYGYYSSWPYASYGYYPNSYYGGYSNAYSYYQPGYGYDTATIAAVQRRLGELGYYHGTVDGDIGPQTRGAIAAFESRNGMSVDGMITTRLLNRIGLA
jgi:Putative peptidoglycan binding domain